jgi:hypothetical protein
MHLDDLEIGIGIRGDRGACVPLAFRALEKPAELAGAGAIADPYPLPGVLEIQPVLMDSYQQGHREEPVEGDPGAWAPG